MGGVNEKTIEISKSGKGGKDTTIGKIRIHGNAGEVHFHDDDAKLKVAVPTGKFWAAWSNNADLQTLTFHDTTRGASVTINFTSPSAGVVEADIDVYELKTSKAFQQLNDFAMGK